MLEISCHGSDDNDGLGGDLIKIVNMLEVAKMKVMLLKNSKYDRIDVGEMVSKLHYNNKGVGNDNKMGDGDKDLSNNGDEICN